MTTEGETYDFIVTGAGSAGCAVAARLSESGRYRVLLLEAGPPDSNPWIHIPLGFAKTYVNPQVNWKFETAPQPQLANRRLYLPRGKTLGGSSSINGMVYMRGSHGDYDEWRQRGCEGWDWDSVLPFFKKAENQTRGAGRIPRRRRPAARVRPAWPLRTRGRGAGGLRCRPASRAIPTSTARSRKAAAITRPPAATSGAGARRRRISNRRGSGPTWSCAPAPMRRAC